MMKAFVEKNLAKPARRSERSDSAERFTVRVQITPDNLTQAHSFRFEIDGSQLTSIVNQYKEIREQYRSGNRNLMRRFDEQAASFEN